MVAPLTTWERRESERLKPAIAAARAQIDIDEQRLKDVKARSAKEQDSTKRQRLTEEANALALKIASQTMPELPRLFTDDVTAEQLARLLCSQDGRIAVLSPEAEIFEIIAGRYSEGSNINIFLKGHAGDALRVDRIGRAADFADRPALTAALCCQPNVIEGLSSKPGFRGRGLLGRFLYSIPESPLGHRIVDAPPLPTAIRLTYENRILRLLDLPWDIGDLGMKQPHMLQLTEPARFLHREFQSALEPKLSEGAELGSLTDWAGKLSGAIARIAGGLHLAEFCDVPWESEIHPQTMANAIAIGEYFIAHARAAFACMVNDPKAEIAKRIVAWIRRRERDQFSRRDVCRDLNLRSDDADGPLKFLADHEFIRPIGSIRRKAVPMYQVNPKIGDLCTM